MKGQKLSGDCREPRNTQSDGRGGGGGGGEGGPLCVM